MQSPVEFTVFTKPWRTQSLSALGAFVKGLGFDGIELPCAPAIRSNPPPSRTDLPKAVRTLAAEGVKITSVAGSTDEATIAACAEAGVPIIRVCLDIPPGVAYLDHEARIWAAVRPPGAHSLRRYGVTIGVQNHSGRYIANAMGLRHLLERYTPAQVGAVLDPAHCALNGEIPELALDIVWSQLRMVNLKNVYWQRTNGPEAAVAQYQRHWTSGSQGLCSWEKIAAELQRRALRRPDLPHRRVYGRSMRWISLIAQDIQFAKSCSPDPSGAGNRDAEGQDTKGERKKKH